MLARAPELQLSEQEAKEYAESIAMVARHYDVGASAKTLDWFNLATCMTSIYGVRAIAVADRRRRQREGGGDPGQPFANGHDAPPAPAAPADQDGGGPAIDWSLMRGRPN